MKDEALKLALEALEYAQYADEFAIERGDKAITAIKQSLAAPVQEHVAFQVIRGELCYKSQDDDQSYGMWCPVTSHTDLPFVDGTEFYTTPPAAQRKWVGLTQNEIDDITCGMVKSWVMEQLARAIEAKLKEKNT